MGAWLGGKAMQYGLRGVRWLCRVALRCASPLQPAVDGAHTEARRPWPVDQATAQRIPMGLHSVRYQSVAPRVRGGRWKPDASPGPGSRSYGRHGASDSDVVLNLAGEGGSAAMAKLGARSRQVSHAGLPWLEAEQGMIEHHIAFVQRLLFSDEGLVRYYLARYGITTCAC